MASLQTSVRRLVVWWTLLLTVCAIRGSVGAAGFGVPITTTTTTSTGESVSEPLPMPSTTAAPPSPPPPSASEVPAASSTADNENKFLKYLFNKYGSKGVISFEGLEHLMHSLGLGGLDFTGSHTLKEHRPDGYDFRDYDIYDRVAQAHQHDGATPEPPVITFARAPPGSRGNALEDVEDGEEEEHHHHHHNHAHHDDDDDDGMEQHNREQHTRTEHGGEVDELHGQQDPRQRNASATSVPHTPAPSPPPPPRVKSATATDGVPVPKSVTSFREAHPSDGSDGHVWQEIIFKDMHDPRHRHPRNKNVPYCLSPMSIVHLVMEEPVLAARDQDALRRARSLGHQHAHGSADGDSDSDHHHHLPNDGRIQITPAEFKDLCPAFLVQLDQRACSQKLLQAESNPHREKKPFSQAWIYASACVLIISLCGLVGVAIVPLAKSIAYDDILRFLIALGVGTLCGDALMHLLPHALLPHDDAHHSHDDDGGDHAHAGAGPGDHHGHDGHSAETRAMWLCLCAFGTAFFMYSLEAILPLFRGGDGEAHAHGHSHGGHSQSNRVEPRTSTAPVHTGNGAAVAHRADDIELDLADRPVYKEKEANAMLTKKKPASKPMAAVAFMVVLGDGLHNITDGLAIGAAFAVDPVTGLATSFAILCHELPHELGDFALLLQTGVSIRRAIFLNIVSSVLSFIGMALGLLLTGMHESVVSWIYAGTAGTFLYIALSDLVPEMRNDLGRSTQKLKVILIQVVGLALGAIIMLLIALNEKSLQMLFD